MALGSGGEECPLEMARLQPSAGGPMRGGINALTPPALATHLAPPLPA